MFPKGEFTLAFSHWWSVPVMISNYVWGSSFVGNADAVNVVCYEKEKMMTRDAIVSERIWMKIIIHVG